MKNIKFIISVFLISIFFGPVIGSAEDKNTDSSVGEFVKDSVITSKIKSKLLSAEDIDAMRIEVNTDNNGIVVLSGTAKTKAESDKAHEIAHSVDGVRKVINRIEVHKSH